MIWGIILGAALIGWAIDENGRRTRHALWISSLSDDELREHANAAAEERRLNKRTPWGTLEWLGAVMILGAIGYFLLK